MNYFKSIWLRPRETLSTLSTEGRSYQWVLLAASYGITLNLGKVLDLGVPTDFNPTRWLVIGANVGLGALYGIGLVVLCAPALSLIGRQFGGKASSSQMRLVLGWSAVPYLPLLPLALLLAMLGPERFLIRDGGTLFSGVEPGWGFLAALFLTSRLVLGVWLARTAVVGLAELHGIGIGQSITSYLIVGVMLLGIVLGGAVLFVAFDQGT